MSLRRPAALIPKSRLLIVAFPNIAPKDMSSAVSVESTSYYELLSRVSAIGLSSKFDSSFDSITSSIRGGLTCKIICRVYSIS